MTVDQVMTLAPVIPVLVVHEVKHARPIAEAVPGAAHVASVDDAAALVRENVDGTTVVLVKASRASRLERVAQALLADGTEGTGQ